MEEYRDFPKNNKNKENSESMSIETPFVIGKMNQLGNINKEEIRKEQNMQLEEAKQQLEGNIESVTEDELQNICKEPLVGITSMEKKSFDRAKETFGINEMTIHNLKEITQSDTYKFWEKKGFVLEQGSERLRTKGFHVGVDYQIESGREVSSIYKGEIVKVITPEIEKNNRIDKGINKGNNAHGFGNMLLLKHTLENGKTFYSLYGHISPIKSFNVGDDVKQGEKLGTVGEGFTEWNGNFQSHLHFAILKDLNHEENIGGYTQDKETLKETIDPCKVKFITEELQ